MRLSVRTLRRNGRTFVGKTLAVVLSVALTLPPTFGVAAELNYRNQRGGGKQ